MAKNRCSWSQWYWKDASETDHVNVPTADVFKSSEKWGSTLVDSNASGRPSVPPGFELDPLRMDECLLARAQSVRGVEMICILWVALENHQVLVVEHQIRPLIVLR